MSKKTDTLIVSIPLILGVTGTVSFIVAIILDFKFSINALVFCLYAPVGIFAVGIVSAIVIGIIKRKSIKSRKVTKILFVCGIISLFVDLIGPALLLYMIAMAARALFELFEDAFTNFMDNMPDMPNGNGTY